MAKKIKKHIGTHKKQGKRANKYLRDARAWDYVRLAPADLKAIKPYERWLKDADRRLFKLTNGIEKKLQSVREPFIRAILESAWTDLQDIHAKMQKVSERFSISIRSNRDFIASMGAQLASSKIKSQPRNPNKDLSLMATDLGGIAALYNEIQRCPAILPPGVKKDITFEALKKRIDRYTRTILKSARSARK